MNIIISPAKRMVEDWDSMPYGGTPMFPEQTGVLYDHLRSLSPEKLQELLACNDRIAALSYRRYQEMAHPGQRTPAIFAYQGIQYQYMGAKSFTDRQYAYLQRHLYIVSGFYGLLRPFDGIYPYRLEMQTKLRTDFCRNLYDFWGETLGQTLSEGKLVIDLASEEYSKATRRGVSPETRWVTVRFGTVKDGKLKETGTQVKMARGAMVRYMAEHAVSEPEELLGFTELHYRYDETRSRENQLCFVKEPDSPT